MSSFDTLLTKFGAKAFDSQWGLEQTLEGLEPWQWDADMHRGTISFTGSGSGLASGIQVLGSHSEKTSTWLWSWANKAADLPASVCKTAANLRALGKKHRIDELTTEMFELDGENDAYAIALVAAGVSRKPCFRGPYDGGAVWVLLDDTSLSKRPDVLPASPPEPPGRRQRRVVFLAS